MAWGRRTTSAVAAAVVLVIGLSAWGIAAIPDGDGVIHGCVDASGDIRVVDPDASTAFRRSCRSSEREVDWNQTGPAGATGERGPAGPQGAAGRTVCKDGDLLLCLPQGRDLRPRLTYGDVEIEGEAYRVAMGVELEEYLEAGGQGPQFGRFVVGEVTQQIVLVAPLAAADDLLSWFAQVRARQTSAFRDAILDLYDGQDRVLRAFLSNAIPVSVRLDGDRVQATLRPDAVELDE